MKKKLWIVLAVVAMVGLAGCQKNVNADVPVATKAPEVTEAPEATEAPEVTEEPEATEAPEATVTPEPTAMPEPTKAPEPTEAPETTKAPEPTATPKPTATPEPTPTPKPTATPTPAMPKNATVIKKLEDGVGVVAANGGVIITKKDGLYGAINNKGEELVPNKYASMLYYPTDKGYFALGEQQYGAVDIFDKSGNVVWAMEYCNEFVINGDLAICNPAMLECYSVDLKTKEETDLLSSFLSVGEWETDVYYDTTPQALMLVGDKVVALQYSWELGIMVAKEVTSEKCYNIGVLPVKSSFMSGSSTSQYFVYSGNLYTSTLIGLADVESNERTEVEEFLQRPIKTSMIDAAEVAKLYTDIKVEDSYDSETATWTYNMRGVTNDGKYKFCMEQLMVLELEEQDKGKAAFLLDFSDAVLDENGCVTNVKDVVKGKFDSLALSAFGYHLASKDGKWFHVDSDGKALNSYADCSRFIDSGYAAVIKEDGMVYLLDTEMKEIPTGLEADSVSDVHNGLVLTKNDEKTFIVFE